MLFTWTMFLKTTQGKVYVMYMTSISQNGTVTLTSRMLTEPGLLVLQKMIHHVRVNDISYVYYVMLVHITNHVCVTTYAVSHTFPMSDNLQNT